MEEEYPSLLAKVLRKWGPPKEEMDGQREEKSEVMEGELEASACSAN